MSYAPPINAQEFAAKSANSTEDLSHLVKTVDRFYLNAATNAYVAEAKPLIEYIQEKLTRQQASKAPLEQKIVAVDASSTLQSRGVSLPQKSHQNCLTVDPVDDEIKKALQKISRKIEHVDRRTKALQDQTTGQQSREDEKRDSEAASSRHQTPKKVRVSKATGTIHGLQNDPKFLREQQGIYDSRVRDLEAAQNSDADQMREKQFPIIQQREEFRQHMQLLEQSVDEQERENEEQRNKLIAASQQQKQVYIVQPNDQHNIKEKKHSNDNSSILESELGKRKDELSRRKRDLDQASATQDEQVGLIDEQYNDLDSAMEEQEELSERYGVMQARQSEAVLDKLEIEGMMTQIREKEASQLTKLAQERGKRRDLEQQAAVFGGDSAAEQESTRQKIELLRDTLVITEHSFSALQEQFKLEQTKCEEYRSQQAMEQAKIGKGTFKHAMSKWIGSWYRDKYRMVQQQRNGAVGVGGGNLAVEMQLRDELDAMKCKMDETEKALVSAQSKYAQYPDQLQKYLALRDEYRTHAGTAGAQEVRLDIEVQKKEKLEAEVRALKARLALLAAEPKLEFVNDGMGDGLLKDGCMGDYLGVRALKGIFNYVQSRGDSSVAFADHVELVSASNTPSKQVLVVTERSLYVFSTVTSVEPNLVLNIGSQSRLALSRLAGSLMVIHHSMRHDLVVLTNRRLELAHILQTQYQAIQKTPLHAKYADRLYACDDGIHSREIIAVSSNN